MTEGNMENLLNILHKLPEYATMADTLKKGAISTYRSDSTTRVR